MQKKNLLPVAWLLAEGSSKATGGGGGGKCHRIRYTRVNCKSMDIFLDVEMLPVRVVRPCLWPLYEVRRELGVRNMAHRIRQEREREKERKTNSQRRKGRREGSNAPNEKVGKGEKGKEEEEEVFMPMHAYSLVCGGEGGLRGGLLFYWVGIYGKEKERGGRKCVAQFRSRRRKEEGRGLILHTYKSRFNPRPPPPLSPSM